MRTTCRRGALAVLALTTLLAACGGGAPVDARTQAAAAATAAAMQARDAVQVDAGRAERYALHGRQVVVQRASDAASAPAGCSVPLPEVLRVARVLRLDTVNDLLFAGGDAAGGGGVIVAWSLQHTADGTRVVPARAMFVDGRISSFAVDPLRKRLVVADTEGAVRAYEGADSASGLIAPVATYPLLGSGVAIDAARDRLYVADLFAGLLIVDHASARGAGVSATLSLEGARRVAFDARGDRAVVATGDGTYVFDHASGLTSASAIPLAADDAVAVP